MIKADVNDRVTVDGNIWDLTMEFISICIALQKQGSFDKQALTELLNTDMSDDNYVNDVLLILTNNVERNSVNIEN